MLLRHGEPSSSLARLFFLCGHASLFCTCISVSRCSSTFTLSLTFAFFSSSPTDDDALLCLMIYMLMIMVLDTTSIIGGGYVMLFLGLMLWMAGGEVVCGCSYFRIVMKVGSSWHRMNSHVYLYLFSFLPFSGHLRFIHGWDSLRLLNWLTANPFCALCVLRTTMSYKRLSRLLWTFSLDHPSR